MSKSWVFALPVNQEIWVWDESKQDYVPKTISTAQARSIVDETKRALAYWQSITPAGSTPYTPPVLREHVREGKRFGSILDVKLSGLAEKRGIYLLIDWAESTFEDIEERESQHVSIGITPSYRDGTGEVFSSIIDELSLTEHPRLRGIGSIQDTLSLRLSDVILPQEEKNMSDEEILALAEQLLAKVEALAETVAAIRVELDAIKKPAEEEAVEASDEDKKEEDEDLEASDEQSEEEKEDEIAARLADKIFKNLQDMRLGERPNAPAPSGKRPVTAVDKLSAAKAKGLTGLEALKASFK